MRVKASDALITVSGDLISTANSLEELKIRLFIIATAWNIALESDHDSSITLNEFLEVQKNVAPNASSIESLRIDMLRIIEEKRSVYPNLKKRMLGVDARERAANDYVIRARFDAE